MAAVATPEQTVRAQAKYVHSSARKARLITDLIRGRSVPEARTILAFATRSVAGDVEKVLQTRSRAPACTGTVTTCTSSRPTSTKARR
jgi:ribosomal protein L22